MARRAGSTMGQKDEVHNYMASPKPPDNTDLLLWWRLREVQYPVLSKVAKNVLAIQAHQWQANRLFQLLVTSSRL